MQTTRLELTVARLLLHNLIYYNIKYETTKPVNYDGRSTPAVAPTEEAFRKGRNFH